MPPLLALVVTIAFLAFVLRRYARDPAASGALWLPVIWIFFIGSRFPGQWLALFGLPNFSGTTLEEGSPLDAVFFSIIILAGIRVLVRRKLSFTTLVRDNVWVILFAAYCFLAIFWSDFPFVAFKRWIKTLGHPVMALVILSDPRPIDALRLVFKRCGFVMLTLSVLFIKYFPEYGRGFGAWTGHAENSGINLNKNELGYCCLIFGLFFFWNLLVAQRISDHSARRREQLLSAGFLLMALWLLDMAKSSTSLVTLLLGSAIIIGLGTSFISKRYFGITVIAMILIATTAELTFDVYDDILRILGKNETLSDRTEVWSDVFALADSPVLGAGFESFWLGPRLEALWAKWWWQPTQAHNGYIETYLNLGIIGVMLVVAQLLSTYTKVTKSFAFDLDFARLRMGFLFAIVFYNITEATFKALHLLWTVFYIISWTLPKKELVRENPVLPAIAPSHARELQVIQASA